MRNCTPAREIVPMRTSVTASKRADDSVTAAPQMPDTMKINDSIRRHLCS